MVLGISFMIAFAGIVAGGATWASSTDNRLRHLERTVDEAQETRKAIHAELKKVNEAGSVWTREHFKVLEQQIKHMDEKLDDAEAKRAEQWKLLREIDRKVTSGKDK
jgi:chromosome segregation ATPase